MIAAAYGTVGDIEVLWTLLAFVGMLFSILNLREAWADFSFVRARQIANGRRILARLHLYSEACRLIILTIFFTIGILALSIPSQTSPPGLPLRYVLLGIVFRWGLIVSSALLVFKSWLAKKARDEIRVDGPTTLHTDSTEGT